MDSTREAGAQFWGYNAAPARDMRPAVMCPGVVCLARDMRVHVWTRSLRFLTWSSFRRASPLFSEPQALCAHPVLLRGISVLWQFVGCSIEGFLLCSGYVWLHSAPCLSGTCIKALSEGKKPNFRDSKLTLLLQAVCDASVLWWAGSNAVLNALAAAPTLLLLLATRRSLVHNGVVTGHAGTGGQGQDHCVSDCDRA